MTLVFSSSLCELRGFAVNLFLPTRHKEQLIHYKWCARGQESRIIAEHGRIVTEEYAACHWSMKKPCSGASIAVDANEPVDEE